jgi:hypothetical protein
MYNLFDLKLFWGAKEYGSVYPDDVNLYIYRARPGRWICAFCKWIVANLSAT